MESGVANFAATGPEGSGYDLRDCDRHSWFRRFFTIETKERIGMKRRVLTDETRSKEAKKVTWIGFVVNAFLTFFKILAGFLGGSAAMIADGVHSLSDFFTDIVVLVGFKFTEKPADDEHNYGHGKYETLATVVISLALLLVGYKIMTSGIVDIYEVVFKGKVLEQPEMIAFVAAVFSIASKELLFRYTRRVGEKIQSSAVIANGWHHRSDAFSSIGTMVGIGGAIFLGRNWAFLDPLASLIVSVFIFKVSFEILMPAVNELLESSLQDEEIAYIKKIIEASPHIQNYHHLRTRRIGSKVAIEVHFVFEKTMSIQEAHALATEVEKEVKEYFGASSLITTHLEPSRDPLDAGTGAGD